MESPKLWQPPTQSPIRPVPAFTLHSASAPTPAPTKADNEDDYYVAYSSELGWLPKPE